MNDNKYWWQSRTMWVNIVATLFALLGLFGFLPKGLDQDGLVSAIMGVVAIANLILRLLTDQPIGASR